MENARLQDILAEWNSWILRRVIIVSIKGNIYIKYFILANRHRIFKCFSLYYLLFVSMEYCDVQTLPVSLSFYFILQHHFPEFWREELHHFVENGPTKPVRKLVEIAKKLHKKTCPTLSKVRRGWKTLKIRFCSRRAIYEGAVDPPSPFPVSNFPPLSVPKASEIREGCQDRGQVVRRASTGSLSRWGSLPAPNYRKSFPPCFESKSYTCSVLN